MYVSQEKIKEALNLFEKQGGVLRTSEVLEKDFHRRTLYHMLDEGYITKLERGVYKTVDKETLSNPDLAIVVTKIPKVKICLISALDFHDMTTEILLEVHMRFRTPAETQSCIFLPLKCIAFLVKVLQKVLKPVM